MSPQINTFRGLNPEKVRGVWPRAKIAKISILRENGGRLEVVFQKSKHSHQIICRWRLFFWGDFVKKTREEYIIQFSDYPDVLTLKEFREMLGGIADGTARKLVSENRVKHFMVRTTILIPKSSAIKYITSAHYARYRKKLKHQIE